MGLYQKHRPNSFEELKGNEELVNTLSAMLENKEKCPHAFLLTGPTGCGKTTIARIIATQLGCLGSDFREIDSADFRGIDSIREIRKNAQYRPIENGSTCRVWLLDECHKISNDGQNALLKMLEDAPKHVYIILCTTEPQNLIDTIKNRCSTFQVHQLSDSEMYALIKKTARAEGQKLAAEVIEQIVQDSLGHPRAALNILEQVLHVSPDKQLQIAARSAEQQSQMIQLCTALLKKKPWKEVAMILSGLKKEQPESIRRMIMGYCQAILLKGARNDQAAGILEMFLEPNFTNGFPQLTSVCYEISNAGKDE